MLNIFYLGGSPCSGKSTIAEIITKKYGLFYFKIDDYLERYTLEGAKDGLSICHKQMKMSLDETWLRDPNLQCDEEFEFYREIYGYVKRDINSLSYNGILTEGAALLPELMKKEMIASDHYIAITPSKEFQCRMYPKRDWINFYLEGCSDKESAFSNWMLRDQLFAIEVQKQCVKNDYVSIINDGSMAIEDLVKQVVCHFRIGE